MTDRRVHAATAEMEVVRYDRAGKWYLEPTDRSLPRQRVSLQEAANYARWADGCEPTLVIHYGLPGGLAFDRKVKA